MNKILLNSNYSEKNKGFTLAEVLMTLIIIGVVAALTIPTLTANSRKNEVTARLRKFESTLANAVKLTELDKESSYGVGWDAVTPSWEETIGKHLTTTVQEYNTASGGKMLSLGDGSIIRSISDYRIYYDINGEKGPNRNGVDIFAFYILSRTNDTFVGGFQHSYSNRRKDLISECKDHSASACTQLIMDDGWEIKNDYPHHF